VKSIPVNEDEAPSTAAEMRALAEEAEAEAAEAEALAAAARARARVAKLRRQAELAEARKAAAAKAPAATDDAADPVGTEVLETQGTEPKSTATEEGPAEALASADAHTPAQSEETLAVRLSGRPDARLRGRFRRPKWSTVAAVLALVLTVAALAGSGWMVNEHRDAVRKHQREAEFAAAARQGVVTLTTLDFNNAKQGVQRIIDNATGSFKDDFLKTADDFTKVVEQSKVFSQGSVQATAVDLDSMTNDSAVVLVASTQEVTNAAGAKKDPRNYRLIVTIGRDGGQLKMSKVEFVP